jgi:hypothetical protein
MTVAMRKGGAKGGCRRLQVVFTRILIMVHIHAKTRSDIRFNSVRVRIIMP